MKNEVVKIVRKFVPSQFVRGIEEVYRVGRVHLVSAWYGNPAKSLRVIGVTGTNGKTTTVNYLNEILKEAGFTTAMFSTAVIEVAGESKRNDLNATTASVGEMQKFFKRAKKAKASFAILEFPSHALHQHKLDTVPVEVAIMTNLTQDHLDYHGTMEAYAAAKGKLFEKNPKHIVLNHDDEWFSFFNQYDAISQKMTYGKDTNAEAHIDSVKLYRKGTEAQVTIDHQTKLELATNLPGEFNAYNMVAAASAAYLLHVSLDAIQEGIANVEEIPGRFERVETKKGFDVVVDYAHTPDALEKLLQTAHEITKGRVLLVFGACGDRDKAKRPIMGKIAARLADRIILTDEESYNEEPAAIRAMIYEGIEEEKGAAITTEIADRKEAIEKALSVAKKNDTVLITGMGHEVYRIVEGKRIPWNDVEAVREILAR